MKKQNGFTLVEILISLALVGVLSVVAINTLKTRDMSEEFTAKRDKAAMNIEGVIHQAMFDQKKDELVSIGDVTGFVNEKLSAGGGGVMRDGAVYAISAISEGDYIAELTIDVNGDIVPNAENQDQFKYKINKFGNLILASIAPEGATEPGGNEPPVTPPEEPDDEEPCPEGTHDEGGTCVPDEEPGPEGTHEEGDTCVPDEEPCPEGTHKEGDTCVPDEVVCPEGTLKLGDKCMEIVCKQGTVKVGNQCIPDPDPVCPEGTIEFNGQCLEKIEPELVCNENEVKIGDTCVPKPEPMCESPYVLVNGECVIVKPHPDEGDDDCPAGYVREGAYCNPARGGSGGGGGGGGGGSHFVIDEPSNGGVWTEVGVGDGTGTIHHSPFHNAY